METHSKPVTRSAALAAAKVIYRNVAAKAIQAAPDNSDYVLALAASWDAVLSDMGRARNDATLSDEAQAAFEYLANAAMDTPDGDSDALSEWVDAFPAAISDMFPPSASTFRLQLGGLSSGARAHDGALRQRSA